MIIAYGLCITTRYPLVRMYKRCDEAMIFVFKHAVR
jgi:hypothetical protein